MGPVLFRVRIIQVNQFLKIFHQTSWQIFGKIITAFSTFIILGIIARNYGEQGTGRITLALTYLNMFFLLADFGLNAHLIRIMEALDKVQQQLLWRKLLGTRLLWASILVVISILLLPLVKFASDQFVILVILGSLMIVGSSIFLTTNLIFQRNLRYDLSVTASSLGALVSLGLIFFFARAGFPLEFLMLSQLCALILVALLALGIIKRYFQTISPIFDSKFLAGEIKNAWPIGAALLLNVVYFRADAFMVAYFKGVSDAGIYNVAYSVFQSTLVLPAFIMNAYYPMLLKSAKGIRFMRLGLFLLASLGTILTLILAPFITYLLTGGGFLGSSQSLQILSLGFPAYFVSALLMWVLISKGKYKTLLIIYTFGLIINLALNFIFIPQYSFYGASAITVISEYLILLLLFVSLRI